MVARFGLDGGGCSGEAGEVGAHRRSGDPATSLGGGGWCWNTWVLAPKPASHAALRVCVRCAGPPLAAVGGLLALEVPIAAGRGLNSGVGPTGHPWVETPYSG